jgi:hypothetical protein
MYCFTCSVSWGHPQMHDNKSKLALYLLQILNSVHNYILKGFLTVERLATGRGSSPGRIKNYFLLHVVQTGSGTHPTYHLMGTWGYFSGCKAAGAWSWPLTCN